MKKSLLLFLFLFSKLNAQPGAYSGVLDFKVYHNGTMVDLADENWNIEPNNIIIESSAKHYKYPDYYQIKPGETPMGGKVKENFYLNIIFKKDTMTLYTPDFSSRNVVLDSIPFIKGTFIIPQHIYDLKDITKFKHTNYTPKLMGDWSLFSASKEVYKCYAEKIEDLESVSNNIFSDYSDKWDDINVGNSASINYSFKNNVIIKSIDNQTHTIYEVKSISDTTFMGEKVLGNQMLIRSLFSKDNTIFALIQKSCNRMNPSGTSYGIYKLNFIETAMSPELVTDLQKKQIDEDYQAYVKFAAEHPKLFADRMHLIQAEYEKIKGD